MAAASTLRWSMSICLPTVYLTASETIVPSSSTTSSGFLPTTGERVGDRLHFLFQAAYFNRGGEHIVLFCQKVTGIFLTELNTAIVIPHTVPCKNADGGRFIYARSICSLAIYDERPRQDVTPLSDETFSFFEPPPTKTDVAVITDIPRLSNKYDGQYLRRRALLHLDTGYPTSSKVSGFETFSSDGLGDSLLAIQLCYTRQRLACPPVLPFLRITFTEGCTSLDRCSEHKVGYLADVGSWNICDSLRGESLTKIIAEQLPACFVTLFIAEPLGLATLENMDFALF
ncbi:hypothetical protein B0H19DRAFT_1083866 [Mycena capillaripes]|nr:hypothetical protein B0H19DRAFT_1083866 [Mycena capillaripes]